MSGTPRQLARKPEVQGPRRNWPSLFVLIAVLVLMFIPLWFFPHPGTNDAIILSDLEWPVLLLTLAGAVAAYAVFQGDVGTLIRAAIGVFLLVAALSLVVGLLFFGNLSNDRFAPLLFFPPVIGLVGIVGIVVAVAAASGRYRWWLLRGVFYGLGLAGFFAAWTLTRGARAWLLAHYGFDLVLMLAVLGTGIVVLGTSPNTRWDADHGMGILFSGPRRTGDRRRSK